jgi:hypothetical protein
MLAVTQIITTVAFNPIKKYNNGKEYIMPAEALFV